GVRGGGGWVGGEDREVAQIHRRRPDRVAGGGVVLVAMVIGAIRFDPSVMAGAVAAMLAGIVAAGSNRSTEKEATHELAAAEAKRGALIRQIGLRLCFDPHPPPSIPALG